MSQHDGAKVDLNIKRERTLVRRASRGERSAYLELYLSYLPRLDHFVRREIRYAEETGGLEHGLIDPCVIVDQVYIAGLHGIIKEPPRGPFSRWLLGLALHIIRQQIRLEHKVDAGGLPLEHALRPADDLDSEFYDFFQPDDVVAVEDIIGDDRKADPEQLVERRETSDEIERQIQTLPPDLRELITLRLFQGLDAEEIAQAKHQTLDEVRQSLRDACQALRTKLVEE